MVLTHLQKENISAEEVKKITGLKYPFQLVKSLIDAGIIYTFEKIKDKYFSNVKIVCEIISVKKDKNGVVVEGDPDKIKTVTDNWNFSKNIASTNPNWFLSEIISK